MLQKMLSIVFLTLFIFSTTQAAKIRDENFSENSEIFDNFSNKVKLTFSVNVTQVNNYQPFLATCKVAKFANAANSQNYAVSFYRASDSEKKFLGRYDVYGKIFKRLIFNF